MPKSPGHQQYPNHHVSSQLTDVRMSATANGELLAESSNVIRVNEDNCPPRFYFPRADVRTDKLRPSDTTTQCPFKGTARYFNIMAGGELLRDAVWIYENPYDEHSDLKDHLAFYDDNVPQLQVVQAAGP